LHEENATVTSEAYSIHSNAQPPLAERIVDEYEGYDVSQHPFFAEMNTRPVDYAALWLLMANLQCSISDAFVRWLASVIERVDDRRIASLLAKQLNDELGNGDYRQIHSLLLERFVEGLAPWRPDNAGDDLLRAGRDLLAAMGRVFSASDPFEGVGALMTSEIFAKKMDKCVGDALRRENALSRETLTWLDLHEHLEVDHAEDSRALSALVPAGGPQLTAAWRGARAEWDALWGFLDQIHATARVLRG
jgi:pyrroloquinoline quinone (PQQ) biosynthesis protein C